MDTKTIIAAVAGIAFGAIVTNALDVPAIVANVESNESSIDFLAGRLDRSDDQLIARIERLEERVCR